MNITVIPSLLSGTVNAIPSKSDVHRILICAALSDKPVSLFIPKTSVDIDTTVECLCALGADISSENGIFNITPIVDPPESPVLNCRESGSTLRFLMPVAAALCKRVTFTGSGRLPSRPVSELISAMKENGASFSSDTLPFTISGGLKSGTFSIPGNISSQYITGLLLALPLLDGESAIHLTTPLESSPYVDITFSALNRFGITVDTVENGYCIFGKPRFSPPCRINADGDWSNAAFFLAAGAIAGNVSVKGLSASSPQGDKAVVDVLRRFGADIKISGDTVTATHNRLCGCDIDISDIPDLLPILAVTASYATGTTRFLNASRLRLKESDRLHTVCSMLSALGGDCKEYEDSLTVTGKPLTGGTTDSFGDHRIAMSAAIAALYSEGSVTIENAEAVNKSYPGFFNDFKALGGILNGI